MARPTKETGIEEVPYYDLKPSKALWEELRKDPRFTLYFAGGTPDYEKLLCILVYSLLKEKQ